jgi:6 kDa early secretory antigenic target
MELDGLKVVHTGLERTASDLMEVVDAIGARLQQLEEELGPLRGSWLGEAQEAYALAKQKWDAAILEMRDHLARTAQQVALANAEYRAADARGARAFEI